MPRTIPISNRLLAALPAEDLDSLRRQLEPVPLPQKQTLSNPNTTINHVYFPQEGMVSLVQPLDDGGLIEVGMIGKEGVVGVPVLLGADTSPLQAMVQIPGSALRMQAAHSGKKRSGAPPSQPCSFVMSRRFTFKSRYRRHATAGTRCRSALPVGC